MNKAWAVLFAFVGLDWLYKALRVTFDHGYHPNDFSIVIALVITAGYMLRLSWDAWNED